MASNSKMVKEYSSQQMEKLKSGTLVSDSEKAGWQQKVQQSAEQAHGAQQQGLARASQALSTGSPIAAGAMSKGAQQLASASGESAAKATKDANSLQTQMREVRSNSALAMGQSAADLEKQNRAKRDELLMRSAEVGGQIASLVGGAG